SSLPSSIESLKPPPGTPVATSLKPKADPLGAGVLDPGGVRAAMAPGAESHGPTLNGGRYRQPPASSLPGGRALPGRTQSQNDRGRFDVTSTSDAPPITPKRAGTAASESRGCCPLIDRTLRDCFACEIDLLCPCLGTPRPGSCRSSGGSRPSPGRCG